MEANDPKIIEVQKSLGKTHKGRRIRPEAMNLLDHDPEGDVAACHTCGFACDEGNFVSGCPNCGSNDTDR